MKAVLTGGSSRVDYLLHALIAHQVAVAVVNPDKALCERLAARYDITVVNGNPTDRPVLEDADIQGFDVLIALSDSDEENLVACQLAQRYFGIAHQICVVSDPTNVTVFRKIGIDLVIDSTSLLASAIEAEEQTVADALASERNDRTRGSRSSHFAASEPRPGDDDPFEADETLAFAEAPDRYARPQTRTFAPAPAQAARPKTLSAHLTGRLPHLHQA